MDNRDEAFKAVERVLKGAVSKVLCEYNRQDSSMSPRLESSMSRGSRQRSHGSSISTPASSSGYKTGLM